MTSARSCWKTIEVSSLFLDSNISTFIISPLISGIEFYIKYFNYSNHFYMNLVAIYNDFLAFFNSESLIIIAFVFQIAQKWTDDPIKNKLASSSSSWVSATLVFFLIKPLQVSKQEGGKFTRSETSWWFRYIQSMALCLCQAKPSTLYFIPVEFQEQSVFGLRELIKELERKRGFAVWHNHSDIASQPHYLIKISFLYDTRVYLTAEETG